MKTFILFLIRIFANDRNFRINVCKEIHKNGQNGFNDQTSYGRFYEACGEFFEAAPTYVNPNTGFDLKEGIIAEYKNVQQRLKENCECCNRPMRKTWNGGNEYFECVNIYCIKNT